MNTTGARLLMSIAAISCVVGVRQVSASDARQERLQERPKNVQELRDSRNESKPSIGVLSQSQEQSVFQVSDIATLQDRTTQAFVEVNCSKCQSLVFYLLPSAPFAIGEGERVYLLEPERLVQAIREAEGVPSYGSMRLARKYGGHRNVPESAGRTDAARIVHASYSRWRKAGRPGDFLVYLHGRYAPVNAQNDPTGLNRWWLANVKRHIGE